MAHAQDQVVLAVINSDPPPFYADPQIIKWVDRLTKEKCLQAEANATAEAVKDACVAYDHQLTIITQTLENDLQAICNNHNTQLTHAREQAALELAAVKNNIHAEHE